MIKILIIDDDIKSINLLKLYIQDYFAQKEEIYTLKSCNSPEEFLKLKNYNWDLIFLDIEMPKINGIELAKSIRNENTKVIIAFITGYDKYMSESYKIHPFDYILKPFNKDTIFCFFDEIYRYHFKKKCEGNYVSFATSKGTISIDKSNIIYFEYIDTSKDFPNRCVKLVTKSGLFIIKQKIGVLFDTLDHTVFSRPHTSFIVNLENIKFFKNNEIIMINGDILPVSQRKIKDLKLHFSEYISNKMEKKL